MVEIVTAVGLGSKTIDSYFIVMRRSVRFIWELSVVKKSWKTNNNLQMGSYLELGFKQGVWNLLYRQPD